MPGVTPASSPASRVTPRTVPSCILTHHRDPERPRAAIVGGNICHAHYTQLEKMIAEAPALDDELVSVHTATNGAQGERVSSSRTPGLKIREDALEARTELRAVLFRWADHTAESRGFTRPAAGAELSLICAFLLRNLPWIVSQTDAGWLPAQHERLTDARRHARRIVQPADKPHTVDVAPCVEAQSCRVDTHDLEPCPGVLKVTFWPAERAAAGDLKPPVIWCPECGATYAALSWYRLGQRALAAASR